MNDVLLGGLLLASLINMVIGLVCLVRVSRTEERLSTRFGLLEGRVTKLEAYQQQNLTHAETRAIYERLAGIEGQIQTTNRLMQTVQEHLLESD